MSQKGSRNAISDGFNVISVRFSEKYQSSHHLYCKRHNAKVADHSLPKDRTLFVVGVPPYCGEESLSTIFSSYGKVKRVVLGNKPSAQPRPHQSAYFSNERPIKTFGVAYVVFERSKSVKKATGVVSSVPLLLTSKEGEVKTGMEKWCEEYQQEHKIDTKQLQDDIDRYMNDYDAKVKKEADREKQMDGVADEEGWITVTKTGKFKGVPRTEAEEERTKAKETRKRKQKQLLNFYTFQIRESKREHIADLRKKFEEDKMKIAQLKSSRRFRPF